MSLLEITYCQVLRFSKQITEDTNDIMTTAKEEIKIVRECFAKIEAAKTIEEMKNPLKKIRKIVFSALKDIKEIEDEDGIVPDDESVECETSSEEEEDGKFTDGSSDSDSEYCPEDSESEEDTKKRKGHKKH
jgi:hypothetical protein